MCIYQHNPFGCEAKYGYSVWPINHNQWDHPCSPKMLSFALVIWEFPWDLPITQAYNNTPRRKLIHAPKASYHNYIYMPGSCQSCTPALRETLSTVPCTSLLGGISFHVARNTLRSGERGREKRGREGGRERSIHVYIAFHLSRHSNSNYTTSQQCLTVP